MQSTFHISAIKLTKAHKDMQLHGKNILESITEALLGRQLPQNLEEAAWETTATQTEQDTEITKRNVLIANQPHAKEGLLLCISIQQSQCKRIGWFDRKRFYLPQYSAVQRGICKTLSSSTIKMLKFKGLEKVCSLPRLKGVFKVNLTQSVASVIWIHHNPTDG